MNGIHFIVVLLVIYLAGSFLLTRWCKRVEEEDFGKGVCLYCGSKLRKFEESRHGARVYCCDLCHRNVWVHFREIDGSYL
jgi:hypothetical protein